MEWDNGPSNKIEKIFEQAPLDQYMAMSNRFRLEWGPMYYRGRTNGSARILIIGQDPAADENVARRILVGTAGQRVQGFLSKIGITKSYVMINSFLYSIFGQFDNKMQEFAAIPEVRNWINKLLDALATPKIEAILAFGNAAKFVVNNWPRSSEFINTGKIIYMLHPTAKPSSVVLANWNMALNALLEIVQPDKNANVDPTPYSGTFKGSDLSPIPLRDFSFGVPTWMGTGNMATRLKPNKPLPKFANKHGAIIWIALQDQG
jgi:uracil-DNA glycosylase